MTLKDFLGFLSRMMNKCKRDYKKGNTSLRGLSADYIFELVESVDKKIKLKKNGGGNTVYHIVGSWLIGKAFLAPIHYINLVFHRKGGVPLQFEIPEYCFNLSPRGAFKFIWAKIFSSKMKRPVSADAIRIKNNIRSFYMNAPIPFSVKILYGNTRNIGNMKKEIKARSDVADFHTINVPKIMEYNLEDDPPYFCEEIIFGRRAYPSRDESIIKESLCPKLWETYEKQGIEFLKLRETINIDDTLRHIEAASHLIEWRSGWKDGETFIEKTNDILRRDFFMPHSVGHGDLSLGNMIITPDNNVYVVDWECSEPMPIMFDLLGLLRRMPSLIDFFQKKINDLIDINKDIPTFSFQEQYLLAIFARISKWKHFSQYRQAIGKKVYSYQKKLVNDFEEANTLLN